MSDLGLVKQSCDYVFNRFRGQFYTVGATRCRSTHVKLQSPPEYNISSYHVPSIQCLSSARMQTDSRSTGISMIAFQLWLGIKKIKILSPIPGHCLAVAGAVATDQPHSLKFLTFRPDAIAPLCWLLHYSSAKVRTITGIYEGVSAVDEALRSWKTIHLSDIWLQRILFNSVWELALMTKSHCS